MTPPIFHLDGVSSAGIYALPLSMSIKIKGNSKIECKVDIQKEVFWSTKIEDSGNYRYIEKLPNINFFEIISCTKWISEPYRTFKSGVKFKARKLRLYENKKGESIGSDSPF